MHDGLKPHSSRKIKVVPDQNKATSNPQSFEKLQTEYASQTT